MKRGTVSNRFCCLVVLAFMAALNAYAAHPGIPLVKWDFRDGQQGWEGNSEMPMQQTAEGLYIEGPGIDPWVCGPAFDLPTTAPLRVKIRMKSLSSSPAQLYYGAPFAEPNSVYFPVRTDGLWHTYSIDLPAQGLETMLRLDPSVKSEPIWIESIAVYERTPPVLEFDFREGDHGWTGNHDVENLRVTEEGLAFESIGVDPWLNGPEVDFPSDQRVRMVLRIKTTDNGSVEIFHAPVIATGISTNFLITPDNRFHTYEIMLPKLGPGTNLRLDPAFGEASIVISDLRFELLPATPELPSKTVPVAPVMGRDAAELRVGDLVLRHAPDTWGAWSLEIDGKDWAVGETGGMVGYYAPGEDEPTWLDLADAEVVLTQNGQDLTCTAYVRDAHGANWKFVRVFSVNPQGAIDVRVMMEVDADRYVCQAPWLTMFPGLGSFGDSKRQALVAGIEYLADEPSSTEKDLEGPQAERRLPAPHKFTLPLITMAKDGCYFGVTWEQNDLVAPVFDSPDRIFDSGAHVVGFWAPAVGNGRFENDLVAYNPFELRAGHVERFEARLFGGEGDTVVPAVRDYIALTGGFPEIPHIWGGFDTALRRLASGWLDSKIGEGGMWKHAVHPVFDEYHPGAEPAAYLRWMADRIGDRDTARKAIKVADRTLEILPPEDPYTGRFGHVFRPSPPLVLGRVEKYLEWCTQRGMDQDYAFDGRGVVPYKQAEDKPDFSRTHWADHANGWTALHTETMLQMAALTGNPDLIERALERLDGLAQYDNQVPRGAQVWEIPLHTPDILASARLVKSYVLGYELSGKEKYLERAVYWAWTGVPFVYLRDPVEGGVGRYATIVVLGATHWKNPVWIGLPVQWCGLVYGDALHDLSRHDASAPWGQIANGITASAIQQLFPETDKERQGLLPDFFWLKDQKPDGPAIVPASVQARLPELFNRGTLYDWKRATERNWMVHAPCEITEMIEDRSMVSVSVAGFGEREYTVLFSNVQEEPGEVWVAPMSEKAYTYNAEHGWLMVPAVGPATITIQD